MPTLFTIQTQTHGRYLVEDRRSGSSGAASGRPVLVGFHGYAENAERHLAQLRSIPGTEGWVLVAVQALHRFYLRNQDIVASWMTREDRELAIADNVAYVDRVVEAVGRNCRATGPLVYAGFSQGVGMAFRAALLGRRPCAGVLALGGDIPPELRAAPGEAGKRRPGSIPRALLARGTGDTYYTEDKLAADEAFLQAAGAAPTVVRFAGGHEWTDEFRQAAGDFLRGCAAAG